MNMLGLRRIFGTDTASLCWASVALFFILVNMNYSSPGRKSQKNIRFQSELQVQRALGQYFAKQFGGPLKPGTGILLINLIKGSTGQKFHEAFIEGFRTIHKEGDFKIIEESVKLDNFTSVETSEINSKLRLDADEFDTLVEKHEDCSSIISLIGVPSDYEDSRTWIKVTNGDIRLGVVADDTFLLGGMIINSEITACVLPKRRYAFDDIFTMADNRDYIFSNRFHYITADNIIKIMKQDRRLFKVTRRI